MLLQVVALVALVALASAGFEHNLYNYAGTPPVPLSDMNGMARFWIGQAWFQVYWSALVTVLAVAAHLLWRRGTSTALRPRLAALPRRLRGGAAVLGGAGLLVWLGSGAIIFYNTNLLNRYQTAPERDAALADVERALLPFESLPLPRITAVTLDVQFYPRQARAVTTGRYQLENRGTVAIEQLHIHWPERLTIDQLVLDGAVLEKQYPRFAYRIYRLQPAMQPGEVRELRFVTTLEERGFTNGARLHGLVANGSFVDNSEITPSLGMSRDGLLTDRAKRRKYGLPPDVRPPKLEDEAGRARNEFSAASDWVHADITMGTDADQTPIAPGYQWWGHQLLPSHQQGATLLVESLAQYSALLVMERLYGKEQMRRFLKYELDRYLRQRGSEAMEELPLARVENQQYIHYQKGSLAMYWLKEVVGEAAVNRALARLLKAHAFKSAPYPNALDFLRLMREEVGPAHDALITDLFEKITLLDVKASNASAVKLADGRWQVSFDVVAAKRYADGQGQQTDAPLAEPFDIGVFSAEPGKPGYNAASVLLFDRQRIKTGTQRLPVVVAQQPAFVGVDPYNKRIDRNADDNLVRVEKP